MGLTKPGEVFSMLGPNGAGKSTAVSMLTGFIAPSSGTVHVGPLDVRKDSALLSQVLGICPQDNILDFQLTAKETLEFYGRIKGLRGAALNAEVRARLDDVRLYDVRDKKCGEYSGGMKRRLSLAIAFMNSNRLVVIDEPTTGVDPRNRQLLWKSIKRAKSHSTILLITHSLVEAEALADRVGIFIDGQLRAIGSSAELKSRLGKTFKAQFVAASAQDVAAVHDELQKLCRALRASHQVLKYEEPVQNARVYQLEKSAFKMSELFKLFGVRLPAAGVELSEWSVSSVTLEEVFLEQADKYIVEEVDDGHAASGKGGKGKGRRKKKKSSVTSATGDVDSRRSSSSSGTAAVQHARAGDLESGSAPRKSRRTKNASLRSSSAPKKEEEPNVEVYEIEFENQE